MEKQVREEFLNIAQNVFDDTSYTRVVNFINSNNLNGLRLYVSGYLEDLECDYCVDSTNEVLAAQIRFCNQLEDIAMDSYIESL